MSKGAIKFHKSSGQACIYIRRKIIYLGKWPEYPSKPSKEILRAYAEAIAKDCIQGDQAPRDKPAKSSLHPILLSELAAKWLAWAMDRYEHPATAKNLAMAIKPLLDLHGPEPASSIGPVRVAEAQQVMARANGWTRQGIMAATGKIRQMIAWGVAQELLEPDQLARIRAMQPLRYGAIQAKESKPIDVVPEADVMATLPFLSPTVATMVRLQMLTGMRPGEVCGLTLLDVDRSNPDRWVYRPEKHKMIHLGRVREIPLLEDARKVLEPFLRADGKPLFSPADARRAWEVEKRAKRKTKVQPSQVDRHKENPQITCGDQYTTITYRRAIDRASRRAGVPLWSPNRLRKLAAQKVADTLGLDAARALLGHVDSVVTKRHYAKHQLNQAATAAEVLTVAK